MKSTIFKIFIMAVVAFFCATMLSDTNSVLAADNICNNPGVSQEVKAASGCGGSSNELPSVIQNILTTVIFISSIIAVIFIIVGGVQYMTSSGDAGKVKKAKDTILYACIGLAVCALAFLIVNFVIHTILKQS